MAAANLLLTTCLFAILLVDRTEGTCDPGQYDTYPSTNSFYGVLGQDLGFTAYRGSPYTNTIRLFNTTTDTVNGDEIVCTNTPTCTLDQNTGALTFNNFQSDYTGQYRLIFSQDISIFCSLSFNISESFRPSLTSSTNTTVTIDSDSGPLVLQPTVYLGVPQGVVQWYRNGINISTSNSYTTPNAVQPADRGIYTANISNLAGPASISYTVFVNFAPMVVTTAIPQGDNNVLIRCDAISYPAMDIIRLEERGSDGIFREVLHGAQVNRDNNLRDDTFDYESNITYTTPECPPKVFKCVAVLAGTQREHSVAICQTTPNVTALQVMAANSTNTSVFLSWTLLPPSVSVSNYHYEFREIGSSQWSRYTNNIQCMPSRTYCSIDGLTPGLMYEFRVRANNSINLGPYTSIQTFTTFAAPQGTPLHLNVKRNESNNIQQLVLEWQAVSSPSYAPVSFYEVLYNNGQNTPTFINKTTRLYFILKPSDSSVSYFLQVRAVNEWGQSDTSATVESTRTNIIDPNGAVMLNVNVSVSDTFVVLRWSLTQPTHVASITIIINELEIRSSGLDAIVTTTEVYTHVTTPTVQNQCFSGLNSRDQYQFCVIATLLNGSNRTNCTITSTSTSYRGLEDANNCESIETLTGSSSLIPTWSIVVIVIGSVVIVFFVFGGCGLYYGIKRNQKGGVDFDSPQPSVEDINGYPYPTKRAPSPSRSCMSYRHNQQHQHGIDWRVTNPIDPRQDITEV